MHTLRSEELNDDNFHIVHAVRCCIGETVSGDEVVVMKGEDFMLIAVIDGLGHGPEASEVAIRIKAYIEEHYNTEINELIHQAHKHFLGSRGAVVGLAKIYNNGQAEFLAVGNIRARVIGEKERVELVSTDGALGVRMRNSLFLQRVKLQKGDRFIMFSDGISNRLYRESTTFPRIGAKYFIDNAVAQYGKEHDDASIIYLIKQEA